MDIKCLICGEPWEIDSIHEKIEEYYPEGEDYGPYWKAAYAEFNKKGCEYFGATHNEYVDPNVEILAELSYVLGDDVDGLAAFYEDFGL